MALKRLRALLAGGARPAEDSVLVLAPGPEVLRAAGPVIDHLTDGQVRLSVVLVTDGGTSALEERFAHACVRTPPLPLRMLTPATLVALRVRSVLVLDPDRLSGRLWALSAGSVRRGVPVYGLAARDLAALARDGLRPEALVPLSNVAAPSGQPLSAAGLATLLARAIGVERAPGWSLDTLAARMTATGWRRAFGPMLTRLESVEALSAHLNNPATILCLGNGPTGMDPALAGLRHDVLFRVNHDWRSKGYLAKPDMVFAGVKRAMRKLGRTPLGVATEHKEHALIACRAFEPWHGRATYAVVERIAAGIVPEVAGPERPTTGTYMLAAAVALQPARLIVAGIDMFRHPDGAYAGPRPGMEAEINAYTPSHGYGTDAAFITACLAHFRGELVVYSPALAEIIRAMPGSPGFDLFEPAAN